MVYDTEAIWHRGLEREAQLTDDPDQAAALRARADEVRATERSAIVEADHVVAVSSEEAAIVAELRSEAGADPETVTVMGGDSERSAPGPAGWGERRDIVFPAGWLAGAGSPNLTSLRFFVDAILPAVVEKVPWIRVLVTGGNPPEEALALAGPNLQFLGYVPDMRVLLATARAVVVPMRTGAGRKLKTLEAMLAGVPTVSTRVGAEGVDLGATGGLVVTDDPAEFARAVVALHEDPVAWREERGRLEAFCAEHDERSRTGWPELLDAVIRDGGSGRSPRRTRSGCDPPSPGMTNCRRGPRCHVGGPTDRSSVSASPCTSRSSAGWRRRWHRCVHRPTSIGSSAWSTTEAPTRPLPTSCAASTTRIPGW